MSVSASVERKAAEKRAKRHAIITAGLNRFGEHLRISSIPQEKYLCALLRSSEQYDKTEYAIRFVIYDMSNDVAAA